MSPLQTVTMPSVHNAVSDAVYDLALDPLIQDFTSQDPNTPNTWTVQLLAAPDVGSIHPLVNVTVTVLLRDDDMYDIQVQGRNMPWGTGVERQFCRVLDMYLHL